MYLMICVLKIIVMNVSNNLVDECLGVISPLNGLING